MSTPVVLVAKQRSGTNLFRRTLASSGIFENVNEVFNLQGPGIFWKFRQDLVAKNPTLAFPSKENQNKIFDLFFKKVHSSSEVFPIVDIKYNSTHNLNLVWHSPLDIPYIFSLLADKNIPVIHLVRTNILETYVSSIVANKLKVWVANNQATINQDLTFPINIKHMLTELEERQKEIEMCRQWLSQLKKLKSIEISYEDLIDDKGNFSQKTASEICGFLNINENLDLAIQTKKISRPISEIVENYEDEVIPALVDHGFDYLIK